VNNEIAVGKKVIYENEVYIVTQLPIYSAGRWWVEIKRCNLYSGVPMEYVSMPEGIND
jgi:hypothetical protein